MGLLNDKRLRGRLHRYVNSRGRVYSALMATRVARGLTQAQLAAAADLSQQAVHLLERGRRQGTPATKARLAQALGVPIETVFPTQPVAVVMRPIFQLEDQEHEQGNGRTTPRAVRPRRR
jgi:transcriptional regulator with XRE-family HTH domain